MLFRSVLSTARVGLDRIARRVWIAVALLAAFLPPIAGKRVAVFFAAHSPAAASAGAEVVSVLDAVDEAHVIPDVGVVHTVLELHGCRVSLPKDFENAVAAGACLKGIVPGGASFYLRGITAFATGSGELLNGDLVVAVVDEMDLARGSAGGEG